jgi:hypothetical protein
MFQNDVCYKTENVSKFMTFQNGGVYRDVGCIVALGRCQFCQTDVAHLICKSRYGETEPGEPVSRNHW